MAECVVNAALQQAGMPGPVEHLQPTRGQHVADEFLGLGIGRDDSSNQVPGQDRKKIAVDVRDGGHYVGDRGVGESADGGK